MKERLIQTSFSKDPSSHEPTQADHDNFAVLRIPDTYGDAAKIQAGATDFVKSLDLQGIYDQGYESVALPEVLADASAAWGGEAVPILPVIAYCAEVAKRAGFSDNAQFSAMLQSDKLSQNPNANVHRDGIGSHNYEPFAQGKKVRAARFVYPIGRPGTIVFPELQVGGSPVNSYFEPIETPTEVDQLAGPKFLNASGDDRSKLLDEAEPFQIMPGSILAFDMTNSPWHVAPEPTKDGAVLTINVFEHS